MSTIKNFVSSMLLMFISLFVAFLLGEIILRALGHHGVPEQIIKNLILTDDAVVDWRYNPGSVKYEGNVEYKYNKSGFRDIDHNLLANPGVKRIVVLGDSVTDGYGVNVDDMFSSILQSKMGSSTEVINIAQGGMDTKQEVHLFKLYGLQYKPDIVIVNFVLNDFDGGSSLKKGDTGKTKNKNAKKKSNTIGLLGGISVDPKFKSMLKRSALIYFVKERLENVKGLITGDEVLTQDYFTRTWGQVDSRASVSAAFKELSDLGKSNNFKPYVIIWPILNDFENYRYKDLHNWVTTETAKMGVKSIDLLPFYAKYSYRKLQVLSEDNVHPNRIGHEIAVDTFIKINSDQIER